MIELRNATDVPALLVKPMLIWTDIPYNTGKRMSADAGTYKDDNPEEVLKALLNWSYVLDPDGTMVVCCDYRMAWKVCAMLANTTLEYRGEVIWTFGLGRPRTTWWPVRHNNLLTFTHIGAGLYDSSANPRQIRLAPKPGYANDKPGGSVWDFTMSNTHPDRVAYPNQKPTEIIEPFVLAHTRPGDLVVDPFCGSGSTGVAALRLGRQFYGCDLNPEAVKIARERLDPLAQP